MVHSPELLVGWVTQVRRMREQATKVLHRDPVLRSCSWLGPLRQKAKICASITKVNVRGPANTSRLGCDRSLRYYWAGSAHNYLYTVPRSLGAHKSQRSQLKRSDSEF
jgi:hypothetical protein